MISGQEVTLRPASDADDEFLLAVYSSTRADELAQLPWSAEQKDAFVRMQFAAQKRHYRAEYPQADHNIICDDGIPVGRIYLDRGGLAFHILDITVLPQHRNAGIGSFLLRQVLDQAARAAKPVTIYVESFNRSLRLFLRLGFQRAEENGFQLLLKKLPDPGL
ncbi:MAG TPA: GNAT family N-acetyltransferase [Candidatus Angelobacter sp.]|nr:GNAT family N-acetyltransferase [Candidatus Angelobacter sp.]